jgi:TPR repeat protein
VTKAVDHYEKAAALGSVKALNGLGFLYFYGEALPKNEVEKEGVRVSYCFTTLLSFSDYLVTVHSVEVL